MLKVKVVGAAAVVVGACLANYFFKRAAAETWVMVLVEGLSSLLIFFLQTFLHKLLSPKHLNNKFEHSEDFDYFGFLDRSDYSYFVFIIHLVFSLGSLSAMTAVSHYKVVFLATYGCLFILNFTTDKITQMKLRKSLKMIMEEGS